ncbi:hypothetical protein [Erwinia pyrifoliae]|uniref:DUF3899 domain-containing protein n=1 Tax=Erwinia pyrifoliae TaxID=79967 RepID=A0ABY5XBA6_ERWPY|nr:hypothetical protein [Erwinia pyrifoliae]AUX73171.1 hypothetical protein CPI84_12165 [Erwinia pyrifoliae]MCA8876547.1 hypothetical protein [Erwinia pyrifoliae]UWS31538.1 hypothetical protein NYP81_08940 [Erwinia pyrifoliae]UWS34657.1 hypothetical protein NYP84_05700 [Erwinia pyrifoliae]UXK11112.1 hypothetical protein NYP80_12305 [Erwinia pyrifoliae]
MIEHILAKAGLFFGLFASTLIFVSFFLYLANKSSYENLVSLFKEKYTFPAPSSFNHMVGFFGVFPVSRFFIKLSKKKKIFLLQQNDPAYNFFEENDLKIQPWMRYLSAMWMTATAFYLISVLAAVILSVVR